MSNKNLSERDICSKFITPALQSAGWGLHTQIREESVQAWKVSIEQIKANGYNLDIKNPNTVADELGDPEELLAEDKTLLNDVTATREALRRELMNALGGK